MKRPAFQFYPADWLKDIGLKSCSIGARGLWVDMLCMAHESERYGHLILNGSPMTDEQVVNNVRGSNRKMLKELETAGVFSRDASGAIYSRRMVRDEALREARAAYGKLGGNPALATNMVNPLPTKPTNKVNPSSTKPPDNVEGKDKPILTPSSSASSASSSKSEPSGVTPTVDAHAQGNGKNGAVRDKNTSKTKHNTHWSSSAAGLAATAQTLGITRHDHEDDASWKDRIYATVNAKMVQDAAKARRGTEPERRDN